MRGGPTDRFFLQLPLCAVKDGRWLKNLHFTARPFLRTKISTLNVLQPRFDHDGRAVLIMMKHVILADFDLIAEIQQRSRSLESGREYSRDPAHAAGAVPKNPSYSVFYVLNWGKVRFFKFPFDFIGIRSRSRED